MKHKQPKYNINELADKWLKGTIKPEEKAYYEQWYSAFDDSETQLKYETSRSSGELGDKIYVGINNRLPGNSQPKPVKTNPVKWLAIAASILICLFTGGYFLLLKPAPVQLVQNQPQDIVPGSNKAILHLANGRQISLTDAANGELAQQADNKITKTANGSLVYGAAKSASNQTIVYDTLIIPRAGTYHLVLADGSKVWLNAATAIRYPESFKGKERAVELLYGEAYFEVVHNASSPFKVISANQVIEDIGTQFNVNAYPDESDQKTTLLEGSVKVSRGNKSAILKPGQQLQSQNNAANLNLQVLNIANTDEIVAWKNGYFHFNDTKIKDVMKVLARWYNIEVSYQGTTSAEGYTGKISRYKNISQVLKMLEKTQSVHFKIEGRRITVMQ